MLFKHVTWQVRKLNISEMFLLIIYRKYSDIYVDFRSKQPSPAPKCTSGILKRSPVTSPYTETNPSQQEELCLFKFIDKPPDVINLVSGMEKKGIEDLQKTDFSPILTSLPCTPMGTPGNTPTETAAFCKELSGNSPKQSVTKTLQQVALLVSQDQDQGLIRAHDETFAVQDDNEDEKSGVKVI